MTFTDHAGICARWVNHSDQVNVSQTYDETRPCTCGSYQEVLSDAYREGFGAGIESADSDRDEAIVAAERCGYDRAVANLRDLGSVHIAAHAMSPTNWAIMTVKQRAQFHTYAGRAIKAAADHLDATKETTL